ncbi:MAG: hypothetical protein JNK82_02260 [Myxococcaceae bacterium]|nr:hypothetical protein [Myxococcaceae bacterium]
MTRALLLMTLGVVACAKPPPPKIEPPPSTLEWPKGAPRRIAVNAYAEYEKLTKILAGFAIPVVKGREALQAEVTLHFSRCDELSQQGTVARIEETESGRVLLYLSRPMGECEPLMYDVARAITTSWSAKK